MSLHTSLISEMGYDAMAMNVDHETLLPCGEKLKPLLNKACISDSDIKQLLMKRGVYLGDFDKRHYIPLLTLSALSPSEFEYLQEKQKNKEDSIKYRTSKVVSNTTDNLQDIIPLDLIQINNIKDGSDSYDFNTDVVFALGSSDQLILEYEILRDDITKDWFSNKSKHSGRIIVQRNLSEKVISFKSEFTSPETYNVNEEIIKTVRMHLASSGHVANNAEILSVTSENFSNKERFMFMLRLANNSPNGFLTFEAVSNIEIGPDENAVLPNEANWMANCVKNMIINGESLQNIEYIRNPQYHDSLILREIEAKYKFQTGSAEGTCIIEYGFPHYFRKNARDKSFQASIPKVYFSKNSKSANLTNISRRLLNEFEVMKEAKYKDVKK